MKSARGVRTLTAPRSNAGHEFGVNLSAAEKARRSSLAAFVALVKKIFPEDAELTARL